MTEQWWTKDEREAVTYAICDDSMDIADRGGIPIALWEEIDQEVGVALEALTPAIERIQREAKAEALREAARQARSHWTRTTNLPLPGEPETAASFDAWLDHLADRIEGSND